MAGSSTSSLDRDYASEHSPLKSRHRNSTFRQGHDRQALVTLSIDGPHRKDDIILGKVQSRAQNVANLLDVFPFRAGRGPPQNFILDRPASWRGIPGKR